MLPKGTLYESRHFPGIYWKVGDFGMFDKDGNRLHLPDPTDGDRDGVLNFKCKPTVEPPMNTGHIQSERAMSKQVEGRIEERPTLQDRFTPQSKDGAIVSVTTHDESGTIPQLAVDKIKQLSKEYLPLLDGVDLSMIHPPIGRGLPLDEKWRTEALTWIAGDKDCLPYTQRLDAAKCAMRETMVAMDAKATAFIEALIAHTDRNSPPMISADGIRKLAREHGLA